MTILQGFDERQLTLNGIRINFVIKGDGPPLLLLHGYPETHAMWHKIAPQLAEHFTVVVPDMRGYGDSEKPKSDPQHVTYSKKSTAADQAALMSALGFERFMVAGHDRGARVTHRMCRDYPERVLRAAVFDIIPTVEMYARVTAYTATANFPWFFYIQPYPFPETLLEGKSDFYLDHMVKMIGEHVISPEALAEYRRCMRDPASLHAGFEDYRAGASIDSEQDKADADKKILCPLLVVWGATSAVGTAFDPISIWRDYAIDVQGEAVPGGHFMVEESPRETLKAMLDFFRN
jgi:haloacetate dehalogenase